MHTQILMKLCTFVLKILNGTEILTQIMGHNSVTNLRKLTGNNANLDPVNINAHAKSGQNLLRWSQDNEKKRNSEHLYSNLDFVSINV